MKENIKINWSFWLSLMAFIISLVALAVFICKVKPYSVVTIDTYIGVIAGFIGIAVTLLVGYQIYNAIDLRQRINAVETLRTSLENHQQQLEMLRMEQEEGFEIIQARLYSQFSDMIFETFLHFHSAIKYSLSVNHKKEGYKCFLDELESYMLRITTNSFIGCLYKDDYSKKVKELRILYHDNDQKIRNHDNYLYIRDRYEDLMFKFEKRLDNISNVKQVSLEELDKIVGDN